MTESDDPDEIFVAGLSRSDRERLLHLQMELMEAVVDADDDFTAMTCWKKAVAKLRSGTKPVKPETKQAVRETKPVVCETIEGDHGTDDDYFKET